MLDFDYKWSSYIFLQKTKQNFKLKYFLPKYKHKFDAEVILTELE